jgi:NADH pyrophosphatase NudC (nudix superfamily)
VSPVERVTPSPRHPPRPIQPDGRLHGVVIACRKGDRWLCIRRSDKVISPLKVCFPGGAIEIGESQPEAVVREMREEVGATVTPIKNVWRWDRPNSNLTLWGWTATLQSESLKHDPQEVDEILWLTTDEVADHPDALPSNRLFVDCLMKNVE